MSFRREKFVPFGGPDGGDGGSGGDVVVVADPSVTDFRRFKRKRIYRAGRGGAGGSRKKHGSDGESVILAVPLGTVVLRGEPEIDEAVLIADLEQEGQRAVLAKGGKGGRGNIHFASSTNQAPKIAQGGGAGEEKSVILELRLIADAGIIGYPNAGKSTLLAAASAARPKIAGYPFTTLEPVLGAVEVGQQGFVLAEIPGLIEDAHLGRGLGHDFLQHVMRTRVLVHMVDGASASPVEDMGRVSAELGLFDSTLAEKPQLVAVNKIDLPEVRVRIAEIEKDFADAGVRVFFVSAATGEGVPELMAETVELLKRETAAAEPVEKAAGVVYRPQPKSRGISVHKEGDTFVVKVSKLERVITSTGLGDAEIRWQLRRQLTRMGAGKALERAGVKPGDRVRCGNVEMEW